jgi:hypothetical protein
MMKHKRMFEEREGNANWVSFLPYSGGTVGINIDAS